jgi:hypothetical protein
MFFHTGLAFWTSFIFGFLISYCYKNTKKYIHIKNNLSIVNHKFIDTNNKCYRYKLKEINC